MRVTGGVYKGRKILCPPGVIRPAMDRMRESVFAILGDLSGSAFLDLYAGSGSVGIEAASRGARLVVFVEKDPRKREILRRNTSFLEGEVELCFVPVERFVRRDRRRFGTIFLDPPYGQRGTVEVLEALARRGLLAPEGRLLLHGPREELPPERAGSLVAAQRRSYGRAVVTFYVPYVPG